MEAFLQLLSLFMLPHHCQSRPGAWVQGQVWGRVGDRPKGANEAVAAESKVPAVSASPDIIERTSASPPVAAVTLEDGRYVWGAVGVEAEATETSVEDFESETLFPVSAVSAAALLQALPDVIELTSVSPASAVTLGDGRYVWGAVGVEEEDPGASVEDFETSFPESALSSAALLSASQEVVELTSSTSPPSPAAAVTLADGRWSWGAVARHRLDSPV